MFADVILEESRFRELGNRIDNHRGLILSRIWPKLDEAGLQIGDKKPENEIEKIIGSSGVKQLKVATSAIIEFTDDNVKSLDVAFRNLRTVLKTIYPSKKFLDFKPTK